MLRELLLPLVKYFSPFNIFRYLTFRSAYAAVSALLIVFLLGPLVIKKLKVLKFGQSVRLDGPEVTSLNPAPTMGGVIVISVAVSVILWQDVETPHLDPLFALLGFSLIGTADDWLKIPRRIPTAFRRGKAHIPISRVRGGGGGSLPHRGRERHKAVSPLL